MFFTANLTLSNLLNLRRNNYRNAQAQVKFRNCP